MKHKRKTCPVWQKDAWKMAFILLLASIIVGALASKMEAAFTPPLITPIADVNREYVEKVVDKPDETLDRYVDDAVDEFFSGTTRKSEVKMILHCLLHRESRHGASNEHGDGGLAGGPMQFHQATWERMRKQMDEPVGSRYDLRESIRTTAWAIANGRAKEWGPVYRYSKGSNYAACQTPSWYK